MPEQAKLSRGEKVTVVHVPAPDAAERLHRAFQIILEAVPPIRHEAERTERNRQKPSTVHRAARKKRSAYEDKRG